MTENLVWKKFEHVTFNRCGIKLLRPEDAREFVRECKKHSLEIAGVEAFHVDEQWHIQPEQVFSTDLWDFSGDTWERTLKDLEGPFEPDIWFEVVIERLK